MRIKSPFLNIWFRTAMVVLMVSTLRPLTQAQTQLPSPKGHVNDFAGVLDDQTKSRLEALLENLKGKTKVDFYVATVETTGTQNISDYSRDLARDWNIGSKATKAKSLLLVVSTDSKHSFTQFSRPAQTDLPDGVLGDMSVRMRGPLGDGRFSEAVTTGVQLFVTSLGQKGGFTLEDLERTNNIATADKTTYPPRDSTPTMGQVSISLSDVEKSRPRLVNERPKEVKETTEEVRETPKEEAKKSPPKATTKNTTAVKSPEPTTKTDTSTVDDEDELEEVELTLTKPLPQRATLLKTFLDTHPTSKARPRATELLISTHAALGDQRLKNGDAVGGIEQMMLAINEADATISDKLFSGVISQIPMNLYLRNEKPAAFKAAQSIEEKFGSDPKRLIAVAGFYLGIERGDEAARVGELAIKLSPDLAEAHRVTAVGYHFSLRLDDAAAEYKKALELDPSMKVARGSLADLNRAGGKPEEALTLYQEQLKLDPKDRSARAGVVLSLYDLGRNEDATRELQSALTDDARNLPLLAGLAYWMVAHGENEKGFDFARKAIELEPRYTWAQIALTHAYLNLKQPLDAERSIRFARQYGKFPTLNYELASVLSSMGLYEEAAEALRESFVIRDDQIEALLAGRVTTRDSNFPDLLAPERRASIFQMKAADSSGNSKNLKALLVLSNALGQNLDTAKPNEAAAVAAAKEFGSGSDAMAAYRQYYAASRLLRANVGLDTALELTEAAKKSSDAALAVPLATMAVQADEFRELRATAISAGNIPEVAPAPPRVLAHIFKGRLEDLTGWIYFNQDKNTEALVHLKRAESILPAGTPAARNTLWHLGVVYEQTGKNEDALTYYINSYNAGDPDSVRRSAIETLYKKVNGSLDGLTERMANAASASKASNGVTTDTPGPTVAPAPAPAQSNESTSSTSNVDKPLRSTSSKSDLLKSEVTKTTEAVTPLPTPTPSPAATETPAAPDNSGSEEALKAAASRIRTTVRIRGRVLDADNNGLANVAVVLISPTGSVLAATTDNDGNYSFTVAPSQKTYRVIPSKDGFAFTPIDRVLSGLRDDQKAVDFVGSRAP